MEKERQESERDQENGEGKRDGRDRWGVGSVQFFKVKQGRQLASNRVLLLGVHDNIQAHNLTGVFRGNGSSFL